MNAVASVQLSVEDLSKVFESVDTASGARRVTHALRDVSFAVRRGETIGIVGESGSGKTTLARILVRLVSPTAGRVLLGTDDVHALAEVEVLRRVRPRIRMIFQDPDATLNPACPVAHGLEQALRLHAPQVTNVREILSERLAGMGLDAGLLDKFPSELSGGEKRRFGVCRALLTDPDVIVADEPLSGLDVQLQERVLALLKREQATRQFGLILISHDLDRVNQVCDRVLVMHSGRVVEDVALTRVDGVAKDSYRHPYSVLLRRASRREEEQARSEPVEELLGAESVPRQTSHGCSFRPFCPRYQRVGRPSECAETAPPLRDLSTGQRVACHHPEALDP